MNSVLMKLISLLIQSTHVCNPLSLCYTQCVYIFLKIFIYPVKPGILNDSLKHQIVFQMEHCIVPLDNILFYSETQTEQMHAIWCYLYGQK